MGIGARRISKRLIQSIFQIWVCRQGFHPCTPPKGLLKIAVQAAQQICRKGKFESPFGIFKTFKKSLINNIFLKVLEGCPEGNAEQSEEAFKKFPFGVPLAAR